MKVSCGCDFRTTELLEVRYTPVGRICTYFCHTCGSECREYHTYSAIGRENWRKTYGNLTSVHVYARKYYLDPNGKVVDFKEDDRWPS